MLALNSGHGKARLASSHFALVRSCGQRMRLRIQVDGLIVNCQVLLWKAALSNVLLALSIQLHVGELFC